MRFGMLPAEIGVTAGQLEEAQKGALTHHGKVGQLEERVAAASMELELEQARSAKLLEESQVALKGQQHHASTLENQLQEMQAETSTLKTKLADADQRCEEEMKEKQALLEQRGSAIAEAEQLGAVLRQEKASHMQSRHQLDALREQLEQHIEAVTGDLSVEKEDKRALMEKEVQLVMRCSGLEAELEEERRAVAALQTSRDSAEQKHAVVQSTLQGELAAAESRNASLESALETEGKKVADMAAAKTDVEERNTKLNTQLQETHVEMKALEQKFSDVERSYSGLKGELQAERAEKLMLMEEQATQEVTVEKLRAELAEEHRENASLAEQLEQQQVEGEEARKTLVGLEERASEAERAHKGLVVDMESWCALGASRLDGAEWGVCAAELVPERPIGWDQLGCAAELVLGAPRLDGTEWGAPQLVCLRSVSIDGTELGARRAGVPWSLIDGDRAGGAPAELADKVATCEKHAEERSEIQQRAESNLKEAVHRHEVAVAQLIQEKDKSREEWAASMSGLQEQAAEKNGALNAELQRERQNGATLLQERDELRVQRDSMEVEALGLREQCMEMQVVQEAANADAEQLQQQLQEARTEAEQLQQQLQQGEQEVGRLQALGEKTKEREEGMLAEALKQQKELTAASESQQKLEKELARVSAAVTEELAQKDAILKIKDCGCVGRDLSGVASGHM
ncbi:hypothetical protein CYMTET_17378 [Cymbomonas tetramitiformis]|uniref:Uncharacterized protein n=1 Tax=Cymbomonas tetramitiformis TaxID=36881 RepID=A0AAE0GA72_9CHLO|nr:hypothetical protein CYMTET_17378 [Cymbomonas tetramitiformis]